MRSPKSVDTGMSVFSVLNSKSFTVSLRLPTAISWIFLPDTWRRYFFMAGAMPGPLRQQRYLFSKAPCSVAGTGDTACQLSPLSNTPNNSHSKRQATIHTVFLARCSAKFHDKSCNSLKTDIYYISSVWQIEGGKPFYISKTSGKAYRAGMWNSVGFAIRVM